MNLAVYAQQINCKPKHKCACMMSENQGSYVSAVWRTNEVWASADHIWCALCICINQCLHVNKKEENWSGCVSSEDLNSLIHMDYIYNFFMNFLKCYIFGGTKSLRFHLNYIHLCFKDERKSYGIGTTWRWLTDDCILIWLHFILIVHFRHSTNYK